MSESFENDVLAFEIEQLRVQLAGCSVAALGETSNPAKMGDYGWSASYEDVLGLRIKYDKSQKDAIEQAVRIIGLEKRIAELETALQYERNFPSHGVERRRIV